MDKAFKAQKALSGNFVVHSNQPSPGVVITLDTAAVLGRYRDQIGGGYVVLTPTLATEAEIDNQITLLQTALQGALENVRAEAKDLLRRDR